MNNYFCLGIENELFYDIECPNFDVPPLHYNDEEKFNSLWMKIAKVVLFEGNNNTIKYINSSKTMHEIFEHSGKMQCKINLK